MFHGVSTGVGFSNSGKTHSQSYQDSKFRNKIRVGKNMTPATSGLYCLKHGTPRTTALFFTQSVKRHSVDGWCIVQNKSQTPPSKKRASGVPTRFQRLFSILFQYQIKTYFASFFENFIDGIQRKEHQQNCHHW